ncbi:fucose isomerase [Clostridium zeae]|uniref:Fucose isomerase n=1 Tax=Clostridium zeae TaxID=2759022 RepID=A0ABQ1EBT3_9CLOT|nr:L-fucose/L-arabinose isomerase family protein [Clostridium zeae]GFZ32114.1 fucose isomerase [Clostridium zeae]
MKQYKIKLGVASTRRSIFSKDDAIKYKDLTCEKLKDLDIEFVNIDDINEEGLLFSEEHVQKVVDKFISEKVDALFFPHCNFGSEDLVAKVASKLKLPVLLWGPRDEAPLANGTRLRDSQCGLFATGKILRRFKVPFTYIPNASLEDEAFERGLRNFLAAANVVKELGNLRILQISTRPSSFWTMMCNEGELLEKFGVQIHPISMTEFVAKVKKVKAEEKEKVQATIEYMKQVLDITVSDEIVENVASLKVAYSELTSEFGCSAVAIQCWTALQDELKIMPCMANALMTDEGIPVVCETDIHGAITSVISQAAGMGEAPTFFADWTVVHPTNRNGELLQHCGCFPPSLTKKGQKAKIEVPFALESGCNGASFAEIEGGDVSLLRFDGDNGEYSMLLGHAKGVEGPYIQGAYLWVEVENLAKLEDKLVTGPYVHHCTGIHKDVLPAVYEACKYIPALKPDFYDDVEEDVKAWIRGE